MLECRIQRHKGTDLHKVISSEGKGDRLMDNKKQQPFFDWEEFQNTFKKSFPFISDEYWSMMTGMMKDQMMDWNQIGKHAMNNPWVGKELKELVEKYVQSVMKNQF
jgi:hypothetical protein